MTNLPWTLMKGLTFLQSSVLLLITAVIFPWFLLKKHATHFQQLSF